LGYCNIYNTAKVYATLQAAFAARTIFNLVCKASSGAKALTNPEWTIPVFVGQYPVMTGKRGDPHMAPVTFAVAGVVIRPQWTSSDGHDYSRMTYYPRFAPARQSVFEPGLSGAPDREYPAVLVEQSI